MNLLNKLWGALIERIAMALEPGDDLMAIADATAEPVEDDVQRAWTEAVDHEVAARHADEWKHFAWWDAQLKARS